MIIPPDISAVQLAVALLGQTIVSHSNEGTVAGIITETEAYNYNDKACHAYQNRYTDRTAPLFLAAGHWYIYFTYGKHYCANISAEEEGVAGGVLLRSLTITEGITLARHRRLQGVKDNLLANGPAKLCQCLAIDKLFNGLNAQTNKNLYLKLNTNFLSHPPKYTTTPRIGLGPKAQEDKLRLWRFVIN